eukprot:TRINITY_DN34392_c0_g1_i1.p2 TRINITY_DN34392_c0_g1~~TRINITY_DN34392_c0_g1_i1.p2  ORF type:complete len:112 (+),score=24.56 TRINITY_DN34392_c0_g1_i1:213-548(+)
MTEGVRHVVMFGLKDEATAEQVEALKKGLLALGEGSQFVQKYELGVDLKLASGQNHPAGKNRSLVWTATFKAAADYESYHKSDEHQTLVKELLAPILEPGTRAAIQFPLDG